MSDSTSTSSGRHYTQRVALPAGDEKKVSAIEEKYSDQDWGKWAARYARKVIKVKKGLRATPAPIPVEMPVEVAKEIRESFLGPDKVKTETSGVLFDTNTKTYGILADPNKSGDSRRVSWQLNAYARRQWGGSDLWMALGYTDEDDPVTN